MNDTSRGGDRRGTGEEVADKVERFACLMLEIGGRELLDAIADEIRRGAPLKDLLVFELIAKQKRGELQRSAPR